VREKRPGSSLLYQKKKRKRGHLPSWSRRRGPNFFETGGGGQGIGLNRKREKKMFFGEKRHRKGKKRCGFAVRKESGRMHRGKGARRSAGKNT